MNYLIYGAYGSNILKERFIYYVKGGTFQGRYYRGSTDKNEPQDLGWIFVPYRLYFAKKSSRWDGKGVAFLSCNKEPYPEYYSILRLWKISQRQFEDIHEQEGKLWYNETLILGEKDGLMIKTFTGRWENEKQEPSKRYLEVLKMGIKEVTKWDDAEIEKYFDKFL